MGRFRYTLRTSARRRERWGYDHDQQRSQISLQRFSPRLFQAAAAIEERHAGGKGGEGRAAQGSPAAVVELATNETTDRRKLRGNPLRESYGLISPAVTIIGKIYTANLRQDGWWDTAITENWLQTLEGAAAARYVADERISGQRVSAWQRSMTGCRLRKSRSYRPKLIDCSAVRRSRKLPTFR